MRRAAATLAVATAATVANACGTAAAQALTALVPRGGQRGTEVELSGYGRAVGEPVGLLFAREGIELVEIEGQRADRFRAKVAIAEGCPLGRHPIWLFTRQGLSRVTVFHVGAMPEILEVDPNDAREQAQPVPMNTTVNGRITTADVDWYRIDLAAGQTLSAEVQGVRLDADFDPCLSVFDAAGRVVAESDDTAFGRFDPVVQMAAPCESACTLWLELRDAGYGGSSRTFYRLHVGDFPRPTGVDPCAGGPGETVTARWLVGDGTVSPPLPATLTFPAEGGLQPVFPEHDGRIAPTPILVRVRGVPIVREGAEDGARPSSPFTACGVVAEPGEVDRFAFAAKKGQDLQLTAIARRIRSPLDPVLEVCDADGKVLAGNDDAGHPDSRLRFRPPADGDYEIVVRDHMSRGGADFFYCVDVGPRGTAGMRTREAIRGRRPEDFGVVVPRGNLGATVIAASGLDRKAGVRLTLSDLPEGVTAEVPPFVDGADVVPVLFRAAPEATNAATLAQVGAHAEREPHQRPADFAHGVPLLRVDNNRVYATEYFRRLPIVVADPCPFRVEVEAPRVPIVRGGPLSLPVVVKRDEGFDGPVRVWLLWSPPGIGAGPKTVARGKDTESIPLNASTSAPTRTWPLVVVGLADVGGVRRMVSSELFELSVSEPWIEAKLDRVRVDQGGSVEFTVALERKREFEGSFAVELHGLPRGVSAEFPTVDAKAEQVELRLEVDAEAPRGRHRGPYVRMRVPSPEGEVWHHFGGGEIRIDRPLPKARKATATSGVDGVDGGDAGDGRDPR